MPYEWTFASHPGDDAHLVLWPYRSLPRRGFAGFILLTFLVITIPLYPLLGTAVLWGVLPFLLMAVIALWWGLERSYRDAQILEELTIGPEMLHLTRREPGGKVVEWHCKRYWAKVDLFPTGGPVAHYVTLQGNARRVEIGAFLSEAERKMLSGELQQAIQPGQVGA